ncbi:hypothetical protein GOBAR_DD34891 [Gossypium barbadense]|nr:hypothetical protein GOBAR_DD34891 [Gossypium barbadense]
MSDLFKCRILFEFFSKNSLLGVSRDLATRSRSARNPRIRIVTPKRGKVVEMISVMAIDSSPAPVVFWKDKLVRSGSLESRCEVDLEFLDGDIMKSIIKGIPAISFSKRIQKFLVKDMATMMVVKLLENQETESWSNLAVLSDFKNQENQDFKSWKSSPKKSNLAAKAHWISVTSIDEPISGENGLQAQMLEETAQ